MLNRRNCFYDHVELRYRMGDEAPDCRGHWKRIHLRASVGIDGHSLFCVESVTGFGTPFSILVCERFLGVPTNALAVPKLSGKIHPLFVPIRISGGAFEQGIDARKCPIQQRNQIVFEIDLQSYVLVVLAAACFECLPDLISRRVYCSPS